MNIRRKGLGALCRRVPFYAVLLLLTTVCIIPLYWMIRASFMKNTQIYVLDPFVFFPWPISFKYYQQVFDYIPVVRYALNTIVYVTGCVIGTVLTSAMAAYAFSRIKWKGRDVCFFIILTSMMLPSSVTIIPQFLFWSKLKVIDTYIPLILPAFLGGGAFNIFLLRQFYLGIPHEMDEAAIIDGAGPVRVFARIIAPMAKPAMVVVGLFTFLGCWNDFFAPLIYLNSQKNYTLALGLLQLKGQHTSKWNLLMAGSTIVVLPCIIVYVFGQKQLIEGISLTGMKA